MILILFVICIYSSVYFHLFSIVDTVLFALLFIIIIISLQTSLIIALICGVVVIFGYGSFIIYQDVLTNDPGIVYRYFWMFVFPVSAFVAGYLGENIRQMGARLYRLEMDEDNYYTIDRDTGFQNTKEFYYDLEEEMARSQRHNFDLAVMIVQIQYYDELLTIYGGKKTKEIIKIIAKILEKSVRKEDKEYRLERDHFAVIMPNTPLEGVEVVKNRIRNELESVVVNGQGNVEKYKFDVQIGYAKYEDGLKNPFEFKEKAERELEYDV
jgi:diguanylate cyclase (GGDEF)-like protein